MSLLAWQILFLVPYSYGKTSILNLLLELHHLDLLTVGQETLIGKRICHQWKDSDGLEQWYYGNILSLVPGTNDWFNV